MEVNKGLMSMIKTEETDEVVTKKQRKWCYPSVASVLLRLSTLWSPETERCRDRKSHSSSGNIYNGLEVGSEELKAIQLG